MQESRANQPHARPDMDGPPQGYFVIVPPGDGESRIDIGRAARVLFAAWKILLLTVFAGALVATVTALQMRNVYRSEVLVAPVSQSRGGALGDLRSQFGGLASLTGIDLGTGDVDVGEIHLAALSSAGLAREFILENDLVPVLFADRWDAKANDWAAGEEPPTMQDAVRRFTLDVSRVNEDRRTGLITVRVEWYDPETAARWANGLVTMVNQRLRAEAIENSSRRIEYLNNELAKTEIVGLRQAIFRLIETQVNQAMLANVRPDYAFQVIDPAVASDVKWKVAPRRSLIVLGGTLAGLLLASAVILWQRHGDWLIRPRTRGSSDPE